MTTKNGLPLFRVIIPASQERNIYTHVLKKTTNLGAVMVATAANKMPGWQVEIIDENNYRNGPCDSQGLPDHSVLQKEDPASIVGFYCGISSTIERVWQLAEFYKSQKVFTIAGARHAYYMPEETLNHHIDLVVSGEAEIVICQILKDFENGRDMTNIPGTYFLDNGEMKNNPPEQLRIADLNRLPFPDFGLLRFVYRIKHYPISRTRGCGKNCEFCSVKGEPHSARAEYFFNMVKWLVEARKARHFFLVDDRIEEDRRGTLDFFKLVIEKYGDQLSFGVQARLEIAEDKELIDVMSKAGVSRLYIGYESPIDEDLKAMGKGYNSSRMVEWTKILRRYFLIHAMFIIAYPHRKRMALMGVKEIVRRYKKFIRRSGVDTLQILHPMPLVGSSLRKRLEKEGRIFPLEVAPWSRYDGNFPCFKPDNMTIEEFNEISIKIMSWFYGPFSFLRVGLRSIFILLDCLMRGWKNWRRGFSLDILKSAAFLFVRSWRKKHQRGEFIEKLREYSQKIEKNI